MKRRFMSFFLIVTLLFTLFALTPLAHSATTLVTRCNLRLRAKANTNSDTLITIPGGTEIPVEGRSGGWTKTSYKGHSGYVSTDYLMELTRSGYYPLKVGDENPYVQELQRRLIELGYLSGRADSKFEQSTLDAVKAFQKANKMKQDGIAGGETQRVMYSESAVAAAGAIATPTSAPDAAPDAPPAGSSTSSSSSTNTTLKRGDRGDDVKALQKRLIALGYLSGRADGVYGSSTESAVKAFQKRSNLNTDGKAGSVTQTLLYSTGALKADGSVASPALETQTTATYKTLKRGMTNNDVKLLQQALKDLGYFTSNTTGYYGTQTQLAVESFQRANSLKADGVAGHDTLERLYSPSAVLGSASIATASGTTKYDTLKEGMKSSAVTTMQKKLKALGYMSDSATGFFGSATKKAVTDFQRASKLRADGIAGQETLTLLYGDNPVLAGGSSGSSSSSGSSDLGAGKISGPSPSSVKLLHWFDSVKPMLKSNSIVQVFDPVTKYAYNIKTLSLGRHFDSEPLTADDTKYMNAAFGGATSWTPKPVWVKLPNGTWTLATMHNVPHLSGNIANNNFDGHLCIHFLRDLDETQKNDPNYGMQHQKAIREAWKKLTGQTVN